MSGTEAADLPTDATRALPWWLRGGDEVCDHCLQRYAFEAEVRCARCDQPGCPQCVVRISMTAEILCSRCEAE